MYVSQGHVPDAMLTALGDLKFVKDHLGSIVMAVNVADGTIEQNLSGLA